MITIGIIGCGYWGINYARVFSEIPGFRIGLVCDVSEERLHAVHERYQHIPTSRDWNYVIKSESVDAVVVATPARTHFEISQQSLASGKHVLVEKPLATSVSDAEALIQEAERRGRVLMVGHTFLYNTAIRKVKELMCPESLGRPYYLHSTRTNMGPIRDDVNALWDLAPHDVAILNYLLDARPQWVSAVGSRVFNNGREDVAFATLSYPGGIIANTHCSWLDPNKVREVVVVGSKRRIVFDDLRNVERVRIFEKGVAPAELEAETFGEFRLLVSDGDIVSPWIQATEPLRNLGSHFLDCIKAGARPLTDGKNGLEVVKVMSAIDESLAQDGVPVKLVWTN